jgi:hypothetical protein
MNNVHIKAHNPIFYALRETCKIAVYTYYENMNQSRLAVIHTSAEREWVTTHTRDDKQRIAVMTIITETAVSLKQ